MSLYAYIIAIGTLAVASLFSLTDSVADAPGGERAEPRDVISILAPDGIGDLIGDALMRSLSASTAGRDEAHSK